MKKEKHIPTRKCIGCNERKPKDTFIRLVSKEGKCIIDFSKTFKGRGAYLCKNTKCVFNAKKKNTMKRAIGVSLKDDVVEDLIKYIGENE